MENKFTPAPWEVTVSNGGMGSHYLIKGKNNYVGHFYDEDGGCPNGKENAQLMAAAPELLEALETALPSLDAYFQEYGSSAAFDFLDKVRAVIIKAKGE